MALRRRNNLRHVQKRQVREPCADLHRSHREDTQGKNSEACASPWIELIGALHWCNMIKSCEGRPPKPRSTRVYPVPPLRQCSESLWCGSLVQRNDQQGWRPVSLIQESSKKVIVYRWCTSTLATTVIERQNWASESFTPCLWPHLVQWLRKCAFKAV